MIVAQLLMPLLSMPMEVPVVLVDYACQRNAARLLCRSAHDIETGRKI
jgi:hypothetical protein